VLPGVRQRLGGGVPAFGAEAGDERSSKLWFVERDKLFEALDAGTRDHLSVPLTVSHYHWPLSRLRPLLGMTREPTGNTTTNVEENPLSTNNDGQHGPAREEAVGRPTSDLSKDARFNEF
jgi:hypothetical protein